MKIKNIKYTSRFSRRLKNLSIKEKNDFLKQELIFMNNCFDSRLKTHKLLGKYQNYWSFSINYSKRIIFTILDSETVLFINVGDHNIYK